MINGMTAEPDDHAIYLELLVGVAVSDFRT